MTDSLSNDKYLMRGKMYNKRKNQIQIFYRGLLLSTIVYTLHLYAISQFYIDNLTLNNIATFQVYIAIKTKGVGGQLNSPIQQLHISKGQQMQYSVFPIQ